MDIAGNLNNLLQLHTCNCKSLVAGFVCEVKSPTYYDSQTTSTAFCLCLIFIHDLYELREGRLNSLICGTLFALSGPCHSHQTHRNLFVYCKYNRHRYFVQKVTSKLQLLLIANIILYEYGKNIIYTDWRICT